jgi:hypothetical protein
VVVAGVVVAGVVVAGVVVCVTFGVVLVTVWPWKAFAAISASAPESTTTAAAVQRVTAEIRRSPASRAMTARRVAVSTALRAEERGTRRLTAVLRVAPESAQVPRSCLAFSRRRPQLHLSGV